MFHNTWDSVCAFIICAIIFVVALDVWIPGTLAHVILILTG